MTKDQKLSNSITNHKMLFAQLIRSSIPKGLISSLEIPKLPKGYYSLTSEDLPGEKYISVFTEKMPLLCNGSVQYKGEPILVICGPDENEIIKLCNNTIIEYDTDYSLLGFDNHSNSQIILTKKFIKGNVDNKLPPPFQTVEGEYKTSIQTPLITYPLEAMARYKNKMLEITTASQWPFHVQETVSAVSNLPKEKIKLTIKPYQHSHDEKLILPSIYSAIVAVLAIKSGKQVKITVSPHEILKYSIKRPQVHIIKKSALNDLGEIIADDIKIDVDFGAYPLFTDEILNQLILGAASIYSIANLRIKANAIKTSSPPMNVFKGCGIGIGEFSTETHISRIAVIKQIDPVNLRLEYLNRKNQKLPSGGTLKQISQRDLVKKVVAKSDFHRKYSAYEALKNKHAGTFDKPKIMRGIGFAMGYAGNGLSRRRATYSIKVKLDKDDKLYISSSTNNSASVNIWKETAGKILGIDIDAIEIISENTTILSNSGPSFLSNDLSIITNLVERCCNGIKKYRFHKPLPIEEKRTYKSLGKKIWNPENLKGMPFNTISWGATVVEIELDPVFLRPIIRGIWTIFDIGKIHDSKAARTTAEVEIYESLAWAGGRLALFNSSISNTEMGSLEKSKLTDINIDFILDSKRNSGGISQIPDTIIPSAFVQALSQATGIYFDTLPVTPEIIFQHLEES